MKKILTFFLAGAAIAALATACNDPKDPDLSVQGEAVPFNEYSLGSPSEEHPARWVNLPYDEKDRILIIDSDEDMTKYVVGAYPSIDFSKKTLLLAYGGPQEQYLFDSDKQSFSQTSETNYTMTVNIPPFLGAVEGGWQVAIIVDKLPMKVEIMLNVTNQVKP